MTTEVMVDGDVDPHELYRVAAPRLTAQLFGLAGDNAEAQDAVHEAFARVLARPALLRGVASPVAVRSPRSP
ncbi:hypothetical protein AB0J82_33745 [Asanoa sp. NPDC049518]|uniref:hypothetical protein n=1 Tax=unclassified Asanoa TaxID=2685164 RepID=UPI0034392A7A